MILSNIIIINLICLITLSLVFAISISGSYIYNILYLGSMGLLLSLSYLLLDAPDVAMTEAALGSAITSLILLHVVTKIGDGNHYTQIKIFPLLLCIIMFYLLLSFGADIIHLDKNVISNKGVSKYYIDNIKNDISIDSLVAGILASYRGFDTLGELSVIFLGGIAILFISNKKKTRL